MQISMPPDTASQDGISVSITYDPCPYKRTDYGQRCRIVILSIHSTPTENSCSVDITNSNSLSLVLSSFYTPCSVVLACMDNRKSFASSYAPKNTAPPALIHKILGPMPRNKAKAPSSSIILLAIVLSGTF